MPAGVVPCTPRRFSTNRLISSPILTYSLDFLDGQFISGGREIEESFADLLVFELGDVHIGVAHDPCRDGSTPPRVEFDITISAALTEFSFLEIRDSKTASLCYIKYRRDDDILYLSPLPPSLTAQHHRTFATMSLARVAVDISQVLLNQWATAPPHKAPQEGRFKTKGETVFGLAPVIFWVTADTHRAFFVANIMPLASETIALHNLYP